MKARLSSIALALSLVCVARSASSQERDPATADALFREARVLMVKGEFARACPKLFESQRLDPAPGTAINLGECHEKTGKLADALQAYRDALDLLGPADHRVTPAKDQIALLEKRVPRLTISLGDGQPGDVRVLRDGIELGHGSLGVALPVNPGRHVVVASARGYEEFRQEMDLAEAETKHVLAKTGARLANSTVDPPAERRVRSHDVAIRESGDGSRTTGYVLGGLGLSALVFGGVAQYQVGAYKNQSDEAHERGDGKTGSDKYAAAERWQTTAIVSFAAGGAALITGGILLLTSQRPTTKPTANLRASCAWGPQVAMLTLERDWP